MRKFLQGRSILVLLLAWPITLITLTACAFIVEDHNHHKADRYPSQSGSANQAGYQFKPCPPSKVGSSKPSSSFCGERPDFPNNDYNWQTNCTGRQCQSVEIFIHYLLNKDLGKSQGLWVEAFTDARFQGSPAAALFIANFDSSKISSFGPETLFLAPGEYYLRAYFHTGQQPPLPYDFNGLVLVSDRAVGVYGALSSPTRLVVRPDQKAEAVHIQIDQLFEDPDAKEATQAKIRLNFTSDPNAYIEGDRELLIQLLNSPDINEAPELSFSLSSNEFLRRNRKGQAEFMTPDLPVTSFYIFAFLDRNGNGYFDEGELGGFYLKYQEPWAVETRARYTHNLQVRLQLNPFAVLP
ncbi:MAG: hypothetical protein ACOH5I_02015 [Oligoflexus sp.]